MSIASSTPETPLPSAAAPSEVNGPPVRSSIWARPIFKGFLNVATILVFVYLTYFFTVFFTTPAAATRSPGEREKALAEKLEKFRARELTILSSYGKVDPASRSVQIPVDRAMELIVAESAPRPKAKSGLAPAPPASLLSRTDAPRGALVVPAAPAAALPTTVGPAPAAPTPAALAATAKNDAASAPPTKIAAQSLSEAGTASPTRTAPAPAVSVAAPAAPARGGWSAERIYLLVCASCHEADGRGAVARKTMKDAELMPDLTDSKWQATRTDDEFARSILEGKGKIMAGRKDVLDAAKADVKEMVALMRAFRDGKKVVTEASAGAPPTVATAAPAVTARPEGSTSAPVAGGVTAAKPAGPPPPSAGSRRIGGSPAAAIQVAVNSGAAAGTRGPAGVAMAPAARSQDASAAGIAAPGPKPVSTAASAELGGKPQALSDFYRVNCLSCHGTDGTGNLVRLLMPTIPDFTNGQWQKSRSDSQFRISILEGKGTLMPGYAGKLGAAPAGAGSAARGRARQSPPGSWSPRCAVSGRQRRSSPHRQPPRRQATWRRSCKSCSSRWKRCRRSFGRCLRQGPNLENGRSGDGWRKAAERARIRRRRCGGLSVFSRLFRAKLGDRLREGRSCAGRIDGLARRRHVVEPPEEVDQLGVLFTRQVGASTHVRHDVLVVEERPFRERPGDMALVAVHGEDLSAGQPILETLRRLIRPGHPQGSGALFLVEGRGLTAQRNERTDVEEQTVFPVPPFRDDR